MPGAQAEASRPALLASCSFVTLLLSVGLDRELRNRTSIKNMQVFLSLTCIQGSTWFLYILNVTMAFGWYWFVSLRTVGRQLSSRVPVSGLLVGGALLLGSLASMLVDDVSRSVGFLYLGVVVAAVYEYDPKPSSTRILWRYLLLLGCITPTVYYINFSGAVLIPFPFVLANYFVDHVYGVDLMEFLKARYFRLH